MGTKELLEQIEYNLKQALPQIRLAHHAYIKGDDSGWDNIDMDEYRRLYAKITPLVEQIFDMMDELGGGFA